jgi:hypothetical protein
VSFKIDYVLIEELTEEHEPQVWLFEDLQWTCANLPWALVGCTMPPVADPENWNWFVWDSVSYGGAHREALTGYLTYAGDYTIIVEAQDDHPESNKAHERRWTLPRGSKLFVQSCAHYGFARWWDPFEDTDDEAQDVYNKLGAVYNPTFGKFSICYSGWYPLGDRGGVLVNKSRYHAFEKVLEGVFRGTLLENSIWTFSGHGTVGGILFGYDPSKDDEWLYDAQISELPDGSLNSIKLAFISSCYSAPDFTDSLVKKGAKAAVGFKGKITFLGSAIWSGWFWEFLSKEGLTVKEAASKATRASWYAFDRGLSSYHISGDENVTIY